MQYIRCRCVGMDWTIFFLPASRTRRGQFSKIGGISQQFYWKTAGLYKVLQSLAFWRVFVSKRCLNYACATRGPCGEVKRVYTKRVFFAFSKGVSC